MEKRRCLVNKQMHGWADMAFKLHIYKVPYCGEQLQKDRVTYAFFFIYLLLYQYSCCTKLHDEAQMAFYSRRMGNLHQKIDIGTAQWHKFPMWFSFVVENPTSNQSNNTLSEFYPIVSD